MSANLAVFLNEVIFKKNTVTATSANLLWQVLRRAAYSLKKVYRCDSIYDFDLSDEAFESGRSIPVLYNFFETYKSILKNTRTRNKDFYRLCNCVCMDERSNRFCHVGTICPICWYLSKAFTLYRDIRLSCKGSDNLLYRFHIVSDKKQSKESLPGISRQLGEINSSIRRIMDKLSYTDYWSLQALTENNRAIFLQLRGLIFISKRHVDDLRGSLNELPGIRVVCDDCTTNALYQIQNHVGMLRAYPGFFVRSNYATLYKLSSLKYYRNRVIHSFAKK